MRRISHNTHRFLDTRSARLAMVFLASIVSSLAHAVPVEFSSDSDGSYVVKNSSTSNIDCTAPAVCDVAPGRYRLINFDQFHSVYVTVETNGSVRYTYDGGFDFPFADAANTSTASQPVSASTSGLARVNFLSDSDGAYLVSNSATSNIDCVAPAICDVAFGRYRLINFNALHSVYITVETNGSVRYTYEGGADFPFAVAASTLTASQAVSTSGFARVNFLSDSDGAYLVSNSATSSIDCIAPAICDVAFGRYRLISFNAFHSVYITVESNGSVRYTYDGGADFPFAVATNESTSSTTADTSSVSTGFVRPTESATEAKYCEGFASGANPVAIPFLSKPGYLERYNDPVFDNQVIRITDSRFGEVNKPAYSTMQAWNADESYLLLYRTGGSDAGHKLFDGNSYKFIRNLNIIAPDIEQLFWSQSDPDILFYVSAGLSDYGQFKRLNVRTNVSTKLTDFTEHCGAGLPNSSDDVQMQVINDDLFGFKCQQDDGHDIMFSYQPSTGEVVTAPIGTGTKWSGLNSPNPSSSGQSFFFEGVVLARNLQRVVRQLDMSNPLEHASIGRTSNGRDAYYQVAFNSSPKGCGGDLYKGVGHLIEHDLTTGGCRNIISQEQGYPYTTTNTHISALAYRRPERVTLSSVGNASQLSYFTNGLPAPALFSEIYMAQTTPGDTKICRLAHHRSYGKSARNGGYEAYFGEPHATISPSGTRIIFGSDWYDSGSVDSFVIELPDYVKR